MPFEELIFLLLVGCCASGTALWGMFALWQPPRHVLAAACVALATVVLGRLALEAAFLISPDFESTVVEVLPELIWLVLPFPCAALGVIGWRLFERWHERGWTIGEVFGADAPDKAKTVTRLPRGHEGMRARLPPSRHGAKRRFGR